MKDTLFHSCQPTVFEQVVSDTDLGTEEWIGQGYGAYAIVENCQYTNE